MDIFDGEGLYEKIFEFKETSAIGEKWAFFKFEDSNFIMNSGSYFVIILQLILYDATYFVINRICVACAKKKLARKLGVFVYQDSYIGNFKNSVIKLFLESYFDIVICSAINITAFIKSKNSDDFWEFFGTLDDLLCSTITIVHANFIVIYPLFAFYLIWTH